MKEMITKHLQKREEFEFYDTEPSIPYLVLSCSVILSTQGLMGHIVSSTKLVF